MRQHYVFKDRYVMDIGCNSGGMLFHLLEIRKGRGVDFDRVAIKAANNIKNTMAIYDHLDFVPRDLDREQIDDLFEGERPDVIFLLSLGSWIKSWRTVYTKALSVAETIFLETNNNGEGLSQLVFFRDAGCKIVTVSEQSLDDCTGNHGRATYMITRGAKAG
jgi:SAM-dependent methyltransferase